MTVEVETVARELTTSTPTFPRYPAYRDSGVDWLGEIPAHWKVKPLKRIVEYVARGDSPDYVDDSSVHVINQACVQWDGLHLENVKFQRQTDISAWTSRLRPGDILVNSTGTGTLGRTVVFKITGEYMADGHVTIIRCSDTLSYPEYLCYLVGTRLYQGFIYSAIVSGSTNQIELSREGLRAMATIAPPLAEQRAIAAYLDRETARIDALVAAKERLIALLQEKRAALISHAVTRGLDPTAPMKDSGIPWLGEVPAHWEVVTVRNLLQNRQLEIQDGNHGELHPKAEEYQSDGIPFIMANNVRSGKIDLANCKFISEERARGLRIGFARPGDVLLTHKGTLGETAVVPTELAVPYLMLTPQVTYYRIIGRAVRQQFLYMYFQSQQFMEQIRLIACNQTTRDYVGLLAQRDFTIVLPPLPEQDIIAMRLATETTRIDTLIARIRQHIEKVKEYRAAIISAAVTGKIDVCAQELAHE